MATKNLQLKTLNSSDYVSVDPFNENFQKIDAMGVDYVTQTGKSGIWRYQRWKSGKVECWGNYTDAKRDYTTNFHGAYYPGYGITTPKFPFKFSESPVVNASVARYLKEGSTTGYTGIWDVFVTSVTTELAGLVISSQTSESNVAAVVGLHVIGQLNS